MRKNDSCCGIQFLDTQVKEIYQLWDCFESMFIDLQPDKPRFRRFNNIICSVKATRSFVIESGVVL